MMKLPNADQAIIQESKIVFYLLNPEHKQGGSKAKLLLSFGYTSEEPQRFIADLRQCHLQAEVFLERETAYGTRYEIRAPLRTPLGRDLMLRTIWQIDTGTKYPRLITLFPDERRSLK